MAPRLELHEVLKRILGSGNVYYQPPDNIQMQYPAIVYSRDRIETRHGNNRPYLRNVRYKVMHIDRSPDSDVVHRLAEFPMSNHSAAYTIDSLNHNVFTIYY